MKIVIVLLALALERYFSLGLKLNQMLPIAPVQDWLVTRLGCAGGWREVVARIALPASVILLLTLFLQQYFLGLTSAIFSTFVLLYCIQFVPGETPKTESGGAASLIWMSHEHLFAILFWFSFFDVPGAVLYRLTLAALESHSGKKASAELQWLHGVLAWVPVRLLGFVFALVGNFNETLNYFLKHGMARWDANQSFLVGCADAALTVDGAKATPESHLNATQQLLTRSVVVVLVVIALLSIQSLRS